MNGINKKDLHAAQQLLMTYTQLRGRDWQADDRLNVLIGLADLDRKIKEDTALPDTAETK